MLRFAKLVVQGMVLAILAIPAFFVGMLLMMAKMLGVMADAPKNLVNLDTSYSDKLVEDADLSVLYTYARQGRPLNRRIKAQERLLRERRWNSTSIEEYLDFCEHQLTRTDLGEDTLEIYRAVIKYWTRPEAYRFLDK